MHVRLEEGEGEEMKFVNHGMNGEPDGYEISRKSQSFFLWIFPCRPMYHVKMNRRNPLYYIDDDGRKLTTRREYDSDLASIPPPFDRVWSPTEFELTGLLHDDACHNEGLYEIRKDGRENFIHITRKQADALIERMARDECELLGLGKSFRWVTKHFIYAGVRIGAFLGYGKPEKKEPKHPLDKGGFAVTLT